VELVAGLCFRGQSVSDFYGSVEECRVVFDLVKMDELESQGTRFIGLGNIFTVAHIAIIDAGIDQGVVGEGDVGPLAGSG